jgi:prepilin-type N-terminal cleavage/methylation domain-containing protein
MKNNNKGFSLLELLIVVAIILIIATIAIPSLLRSRQASNESSAVGDMRTINTSEVTYSSSNAQQFGTFANLMAAGLLDGRFANVAVAPGLHGQIYTEGVVGILDNGGTGNDVGGAPPPAYGFAQTPQAGAARYGYCSGTDAVVRYNAVSTGNVFPVGPPAKVRFDPVQ